MYPSRPGQGGGEGHSFDFDDGISDTCLDKNGRAVPAGQRKALQRHLVHLGRLAIH